MQDLDHASTTPQVPARLERLDLYRELQRRASALMRMQPAGHTLEATALVHEAYLRVSRDKAFHGREHLLATAAQAMRSVLVDHARRACRAKRTPRGERVPLDESVAVTRNPALELVALDETLERLNELDPDMARAVEMRLFNAWTIEETARQIGMSKRTFERRWRQTRDWFLKQVG